jgi:hypothetical protein
VGLPSHNAHTYIHIHTHTVKAISSQKNDNLGAISHWSFLNCNLLSGRQGLYSIWLLLGPLTNISRSSSGHRIGFHFLTSFDVIHGQMI